MANEQNQSSVAADKNGLPTRMLRIEGERTARMFANAIRVSRIDARLRELSLSTKSEQRKQYRLGDEGFIKAMAQFEDLLTLIEKDVASINANQTGQQRKRQNGQGSQPQSRGDGQRTVERIKADVTTRNERQGQDKPQQQPAKQPQTAQQAKAQQSQPKAQAQANKPQQAQQQPQAKPQAQPQPQPQPAKPAPQSKPQQASKQQPAQKPANPNKGQQAKAGQQHSGDRQQTKQAAQGAATATPALS